jgi:cell division protein FtsB
MPAPSRRVARDRRRRAKRFAALVAGLLVLALYVGPVRSYLSAKQATREARADVQRLRAQHRGLTRRLKTARSDAAVIAEARQIGFIYPGETPYVVHLGP